MEITLPTIVYAGLQPALADQMGDSGNLKFAVFKFGCGIFRQPRTRKRQHPPGPPQAGFVPRALLLGTTNWRLAGLSTPLLRASLIKSFFKEP
jgi:hypothetical protein